VPICAVRARSSRAPQSVKRAGGPGDLVPARALGVQNGSARAGRGHAHPFRDVAWIPANGAVPACTFAPTAGPRMLVMGAAVARASRRVVSASGNGMAPYVYVDELNTLLCLYHVCKQSGSARLAARPGSLHDW
jgi:hypothetical protein